MFFGIRSLDGLMVVHLMIEIKLFSRFIFWMIYQFQPFIFYHTKTSMGLRGYSQIHPPGQNYLTTLNLHGRIFLPAHQVLAPTKKLIYTYFLRNEETHGAFDHSTTQVSSYPTTQENNHSTTQENTYFTIQKNEFFAKRLP